MKDNAQTEARPKVCQLGAVATVLDEVRKEEWRTRLAFFDSVLAESQSAGRGQYRRSWSSPAGNIYAALRLPMEAPFAGTEAAVVIGAWLVKALRAEGFPCLLKWPNDVVLMDGETPRKVCGILLEERDQALFAGIGINVVHSPSEDELRSGAALPAGSLAGYAQKHGIPEPERVSLWKSLVNHLFSSYTQSRILAPGFWREEADSLLLWRNQPVALEDGGRLEYGTIRGVGPNGELMLSSQCGMRQFLSGSIRRSLGWGA